MNNIYSEYMLSETVLQSVRNRRQLKYIKPSKEWDDLSSVLLQKIHLSNEYRVGVDTCATNIIHNLFTHYMYDINESIIITTNSEHPSIFAQFNNSEYKGERNNVSYDIITYNSNAPKVYLFDIEDISTLDFISDAIQNTKNIFLYTKGCNSQTGKIYTDNYMDNIKKYIHKISPSVKILHCIDDVQSLFIINRDYNNYDYIISTAHAIIPPYDMGIIIYKDINNDFGYQILPWLDDYIKKWGTIQEIIQKIYQIRNTIIQEISSIAPKDMIISDGDDYNPNIINITIPKKYYIETLKDLKKPFLEKYGIKLEGYGFDMIHCPEMYIRVRCIELLVNIIPIGDVINRIKEVLQIFIQKV